VAQEAAVLTMLGVMRVAAAVRGLVEGAAPAPLVMSVPLCSRSQCPDVDRTTDLVVSWTGGTSGEAVLTLNTNEVGLSTAITCSFSAAASTGTVTECRDGSTGTAVG
jgi:hypothetical protein